MLLMLLHLDLDRCRRTRGRLAIFVGAFCVHPSQVTVLNEGFIPSKEEILHAQQLISIFEIQYKQGKAAIQFKGKMIETPVVTRAKNLLNRARL